jgi:hypothetical protein
MVQKSPFADFSQDLLGLGWRWDGAVFISSLGESINNPTREEISKLRTRATVASVIRDRSSAQFATEACSGRSIPVLERVLVADVERAKKRVQIARNQTSTDNHANACRKLLTAIERLHWFLIDGTIPADLKEKSSTASARGVASAE